MATLDELLALLPDNTSGLIDASDLREIVTVLWQRSGVTSSGMWKYAPADFSQNPGDKFFQTNNTTEMAVTQFRFGATDLNNIDFTALLQNSVRFVVQAAANAENWASFLVLTDVDPVVANGKITLAVKYENGPGSFDLSQWQDFIFFFTLGDA